MILSLIKILLFVVVVTALTFGATQLMDVSGGATIAIAGLEITLSPLQLAFGFVEVSGCCVQVLEWRRNRDFPLL